MRFLAKKHTLPTGLVIAILTASMLYVGVAIILNNPLELQNIFVFITFGVLLGTIFACFVYFRLAIGFYLFLVSYIVAFATMFVTFTQDLDGWGGIIAIIQLMFILGIGLISSLVAEFVIFIIRRSKENKNR